MENLEFYLNVFLKDIFICDSEQKLRKTFFHFMSAGYTKAYQVSANICKTMYFKVFFKGLDLASGLDRDPTSKMFGY